MKNLFRKIPIFLTVFVLVLSCVLFPAPGAFAYEVNSVYLQPYDTTDSYRAFVYTGVGVALRSSQPSVVYTTRYIVDLDMLNFIESNVDGYRTFQSLSSSYKVSDAYDDPLYPYSGYLVPLIANVELNGQTQTNPIPLSYFDSYDTFYSGVCENGGAFNTLRNALENGSSVSFVFQSLTPNPGFYVYSENVPTEPLYKSAWDLFVKFIYGEGAELTPEQTLTLTILSTLAAICVVLIPFLLVWLVFKLIFRW